MKLRRCIISHNGPAYRRGRDVMERVLRYKFHWQTMTDDIETFVRSYIHCVSNVGGKKIPNLFGQAVHRTKPNDLVQFDYIEIGPVDSCYKYFLMFRDDHSDYKCIFCFPNTKKKNAAHDIIDFCAADDVPGRFMFYGPTHV